MHPFNAKEHCKKAMLYRTHQWTAASSESVKRNVCNTKRVRASTHRASEAKSKNLKNNHHKKNITGKILGKQPTAATFASLRSG